MHQTGHALSTTLIIMIFFSILSLNIAKNSLLDFKIAHAFSQRQLQEERHLSALKYLEINILPNLIDPQSSLYEQFNNLLHTDSFQITIPLATVLNLEESQGNLSDIDVIGYLDPQANITRLPLPTHDISSSEDIQKLRAEILDPNTGKKFIATYQYNIIDHSNSENLKSVQRLSFRKISLRSDTNV